MHHRAVDQSVIGTLESKLIHGGARWIADLTEFFRDYKIGDTTFALYARGRTRGKGLFLSRFFAWTALPDYAVSLLCVEEGEISLNLEKLRKRIDAAVRVIGEQALQWAWLIVFSERELQPQVVSFVSRYDKKELGLAIASTSSGQIIVSNSHVGRSIQRHLNLPKVLASWRDLSRKH